MWPCPQNAVFGLHSQIKRWKDSFVFCVPPWTHFWSRESSDRVSNTGGRVFLSGSPPFCFLAGHHWPLLLCCLFLCSQIAITAFFIAHTFPALLLMAATKCPWIFKIPVLFRPPLPPIPLTCFLLWLKVVIFSSFTLLVSCRPIRFRAWPQHSSLETTTSHRWADFFDPGELLVVTISQVLSVPQTMLLFWMAEYCFSTLWLHAASRTNVVLCTLFISTVLNVPVLKCICTQSLFSLCTCIAIIRKRNSVSDFGVWSIYWQHSHRTIFTTETTSVPGTIHRNNCISSFVCFHFCNSPRCTFYCNCKHWFQDLPLMALPAFVVWWRFMLLKRHFAPLLFLPSEKIARGNLLFDSYTFSHFLDVNKSTLCWHWQVNTTFDAWSVLCSVTHEHL